jgi:hypothetical protein
VSYHIGIYVGDALIDPAMDRQDDLNRGKTPITSADRAKDILNGRTDAAGRHDLTSGKAARAAYGVRIEL